MARRGGGRRARAALAGAGGLAVTLAGGCSADSAECTGVRSVGIVLAVTNADTGEPICDATVRLEHARYAEQLTAEGPDPCRYLGGNVSGTYTVTVTRDGYAAASAVVEVAASGDCGVEPEEVEIRLTPTGD